MFKFNLINKKACIIDFYSFIFTKFWFSLFSSWYWTDFSDLDYEMDTCFLHSMLHVNFDLKKDFIEIWISFDFNKILSKLYFFVWEIHRLD